MPTVGDTKLIGSTWNDGLIDGKVDVKPGSTITDKIEVVMSLWILQHSLRCMQIDVFQSECIHSRKDLKASLVMQKSLVVPILPFFSDCLPCALSSCASFPGMQLSPLRGFFSFLLFPYR